MLNIDLTRYLRALRTWAWLLVLCPLLAVVGAGLVTRVMPPVYEAQASVLVKPAQPLATADPTVVALSADQISTCWSVTTIAMTVLPLSWPRARPACAPAEPADGPPGYRRRGRPMAAL